MYDKVGFEDYALEKLLDKLNREIILQWTCKLDKPECIKKSVDLFAAWRNDSTKQIPRNARPAVYCTAIKEGSSSDWDFLWNHYRHTNFASEKKIIIDALGCSNNKTVLQNYLKEAIKKYNPTNADIRRQDVSAVFTSVYSAGSVGVNVTLNFLTENIDTLYDYFQKWDDIANLFVNTAAHVSTEVEYGQAKYFVERHERRFPENLQVRLRSAVTTAESNLLWFKNNGYKIRQWIMSLNPEKQKPDSSTRIESFNIVLTTLIALVSYLLSRF
ncbi:PREDICTED: aminopeptidase N-like [Wasmannia auropunctata]|uniref:aminopeptidase N-like n=1 Tax=Wasmannia auropunctata TaxID=64793 RepID=UPI0005ED9ED4|nr:PREDICTED: aminopeptidase N-like [Wasmannia auropunctata]